MVHTHDSETKRVIQTETEKLNETKISAKTDTETENFGKLNITLVRLTSLLLPDNATLTASQNWVTLH
jgi:hypothetical protein